MYNVLISGASGRMGKEVASKIEESSNLKVVCGIDKEDVCVRFSYLF